MTNENKQDINTTQYKEEKNNKKSQKGLIIGVIIAIIIITLAVGGYFAYNNGLFNKLESIIGITVKIPTGKYELIEMSSGETIYSQEELNALKSFGLSITLEVRDDKTGTLDMSGDKQEFTYDNKNISINNQSTQYIIDDNKITFEQDGDKLVFQKID